MTEEYDFRLLPEQAYDDKALRQYISREKKISPERLMQVRVLRRSIDARQRRVYVNLKVRVYVDEYPQDRPFEPVVYPDVSDKPQVVVVGAGPGGLFAALRLVELGLRPIVLERGKDVRERKKDTAAITRNQRVNPESNYCFGEGGAGAFSDGKLYTRSKKRGNVEKILRVFCQHGASESILIDAHPHIGTDKLPSVIENMRKTIQKSGGEVRFQTRMERFVLNGDRVVGVVARDLTSDTEEEFRGPVILATGHSARDVFRYLAASEIEMEQKGLAVGVRLEHPAKLIDQIQYHSREGRGRYLPAAEYSFVTQVDGRGVYSFCMCPGGFVIPAATDDGQLVVNGMSPSNRGTRWSNSGMVVEVRPEDLKELMGQLPQFDEIADEQPVLGMMRFQETLERLCWTQAGRTQTAPAQRMADFVNGHLQAELPPVSYAPGAVASPLHFWLPRFVSHRLQEGFKTFGRHSHGFLTNEAVLIGVETRTSSPLRIPRLGDSLQHVRLQGLFPCGEGAGYAGGIVSAGVDGERCAEACKAAM